MGKDKKKTLFVLILLSKGGIFFYKNISLILFKLACKKIWLSEWR